MSEKRELLKFVMQGRLDCFRSCALLSPVPGASFQETEKNGPYYYYSGMDYAPFNGVIEKSEKEILSEEEIERAVEFFRLRKTPFIWWTGAKNLKEKNFQFGGILTGIALNISKEVPFFKPSSSSFKIKVVQSEEELRIFTTIASKIFGINGSSFEQYLAVNRATVQQKEGVLFLAYSKDIPVGAATLSTFPASAGIWNLATLSEWRKAGVATALVYAALLEAQKRHYSSVMAILMPKGMARDLFTKFGFKEVCQFPFWVYGVSADALEE